MVTLPTIANACIEHSKLRIITDKTMMEIVCRLILASRIGKIIQGLRFPEFHVIDKQFYLITTRGVCEEII